MRKTDHTPHESGRSTDRIFREDDRWFVRTREGMRGPFGSRRAAHAEAELFVDTVKYLEEKRSELPPDLDEGDIDLVDMNGPPWR